MIIKFTLLDIPTGKRKGMLEFLHKTTRLDTDWERMNKLENRRKLSRMKHRELEKGKE